MFLRTWRVALFVFMVFAGWSTNSVAQSQPVLDYRLRSSNVDRSLEAALLSIESTEAVKFYFMPEWIKGKVVRADMAGLSLRVVLDELFLGSELSYIQPNNVSVIIIRDPSQSIRRSNLLNQAFIERKQVESVSFGEVVTTGTTKVKISGRVLDGKTNEPLAGVSLQIPEINFSSVSNEQGQFTIDVAPREYVLVFRYVNYEEKVLSVKAFQDGELKILMEETPTVLQEIVVQAGKDATTNNLGQIQLNVKDIKRAPSLLGEADLIRQIQTMPGVTTVGEAASGFNVRGGSVDQNLILYDGLPVFNSSHLFGFFSVFNAETIRDVNFYRGAVPAEYGGRSSSVLDIRSKEGSYDTWGLSGGIGIISTNVMVSGPIVKDKTSVLASIRTTYSDWLLNTVRSNYINLENSSVSFYDGNIKLAHKFSDRTKLTWSTYLSYDRFRLQGDSTFQWGTRLTSLRLNHEFSSKLSAFFSAGWGAYSYDVFDRDPTSGFTLNYRITHPSASADFLFQSGRHKVSFGAQSTFYGFDPGTLTPSSQQSDKKYIQMERQRSQELAIYMADQLQVARNIHLDFGFRLSMFRSLGPGTVYRYRSGEPLSPVNVIDSVRYQSGQEIASYLGPEPRMSVRYEFSPTSSVKLSINRMYQYLHLVTNTTAITPIDIWQPSGYYFKPQYADQASLGFNRSFKDRKYEIIVEGYYKLMRNVLDFKDGAQLILNPKLETDLVQGDGRAYGAEFQLNKLSGRLTGAFSYTFSRSFRTIRGFFPEESINDGVEYAANFDQPHVVNLSWKYNLSRRIMFTGSFTYRTGRPVTLPLTAFSIENYTVSSFSKRNEFRIPDYHRLDFALVIEGSHKRSKFWDGTWTFSFFNVYGRRNPYSVFFKEVRPGILRPYQLSIIGTIVPSISYSFKI